MKHNNQHIVKKSYAKPVIEEVMIDVAISLNPSASGEVIIDPDDPNFPNSTPDPQAVYYGTDSYKSPSTPFGDSPEY